MISYLVVISLVSHLGSVGSAGVPAVPATISMSQYQKFLGHRIVQIRELQGPRILQILRDYGS